MIIIKNIVFSKKNSLEIFKKIYFGKIPCRFFTRNLSFIGKILERFFIREISQILCPMPTKTLDTSPPDPDAKKCQSPAKSIILF